MAWSVELSESADRELGKLDPPQRKRILKFLQQRVARLEDPRNLGQAHHWSLLGEFWKCRVGDHRLVCKIEHDRLLVLVLRVGRREQVYRRACSVLLPIFRVAPSFSFGTCRAEGWRYIQFGRLWLS